MNLLAVQTMAKREPFQGGLEVRQGEGKEKGAGGTGAAEATVSYNYAEQ